MLIVLQIITIVINFTSGISEGVYMISVLLSFVLHGAHQPVVFMRYLENLYGPRNGGILSAVIFLAVAFGNFFNWLIAVNDSRKLIHHISCNNTYHVL